VILASAIRVLVGTVERGVGLAAEEQERNPPLPMVTALC
jgi:hypothetical protein